MLGSVLGMNPIGMKMIKNARTKKNNPVVLIVELSILLFANSIIIPTLCRDNFFELSRRLFQRSRGVSRSRLGIS